MNVTIFASGKGSNTENLIKYFEKSNIKINFIVCNKDCGAVEIAKNNSIDYLISNDWNKIIKDTELHETNLVVLAGFLKKVPKEFLNKFETINTHPSLLPKFGGEGMYGNNVHEAILKSVEKESGITIHKVNGEYDKGEIILQEKCDIDINETIETLREKIRELEFKYLPIAIENILLK